jgi:hypothetical protein
MATVIATGDTADDRWDVDVTLLSEMDPDVA